MPKERITAAIREVLNEQFGFEIYIVMKQEEQLVKRFVLDEGNPNETNGFKTKLRESIKEAIEKHVDIESSSEFFETNGTRVLILDTDIGEDISNTIYDLSLLLTAYKKGLLVPDDE